MAKEKIVSGKLVRMRKSHKNSLHRNGAEWSSERLEQWAESTEGEPVFVSKLKRMLLKMIKEGKVSPDGTDKEGNPTFTFK